MSINQLTDLCFINGPSVISCDGQAGEHFVWKDYGLELVFPANCSQQIIHVNVSSFLPVCSELCPGVHIVSSVYHLDCSIKHFDKAVTLYIQHCVNLWSAKDCQKMCFIVQHGNDTQRVTGIFNPYDSYGMLKVNNFCYIFIVWEAEGGINIRPLHLSINPYASSTDHANIGQQETSSSSSSDHSSSAELIAQVHSSSSQVKGQQQLQLTNDNSAAAQDNSPPCKYEEMLVVPSYRSSMINKDWCGLFSLYRSLDGWRSVQ